MSPLRHFYILLLGTGLVACAPPGELPEAGPVIPDYGAVYEVPKAASVGTPADGVRAVFDVGESPSDPGDINPRIITIARYLNMHAQADYARSNVRAVLVLHGPAAKDALRNFAYRRRHGADNPNRELLAKLHDAGVEIYICGQSATSRGYKPEEIDEPVETALSAMTVLAQAQADGYALIAF